MLGREGSVARHGGAELDGVRRRRVEVDVEGEQGSLLVGLTAEKSEAGDPHRAGALDSDRPPQAARVPVGVEAVPVLEHAGQRALRGEVGGPGARHLDREHVLVTGTGGVGHVELVGAVALGVAHVLAVQPHVALVEQPVEHQPVALVVGRRVGPEPPPVQQRAVALGERRRGAPVARHRQLLPPGVVEPGLERGPAEGVVGLGGEPRAREVHRAGDASRSSPTERWWPR
ncbi:MAG: hypothetical protein IPM45_08160 [Acidimicrobiales bacterium]|nr:hypothetical protein [Acidimicrobiales bacterium]